MNCAKAHCNYLTCTYKRTDARTEATFTLHTFRRAIKIKFIHSSAASLIFCAGLCACACVCVWQLKYIYYICIMYIYVTNHLLDFGFWVGDWTFELNYLNFATMNIWALDYPWSCRLCQHVVYRIWRDKKAIIIMYARYTFNYKQNQTRTQQQVQNSELELQRFLTFARTCKCLFN